MPYASSPPFTHDAIRACLTREGAEALAMLGDAFASPDQFIRRTAIEIIGRHPEGRKLRDIVQQALGDPSGYVVRTACEVVAQWTDDEAHDALAALLRDPAPATREVAVRVICAIWREADFQPLFHIFTRDPERAVRREAAWTLRQRVGTSDWQQLSEAFCHSNPPRHRVWACELAATFGRRPAPAWLEALLLDPDGHVRQAAARAAQALSSCERSDGAGIRNGGDGSDAHARHS